MNPQWSDEVKEKYIKDQAFFAECTARGIQICQDTATVKLAVRNKPWVGLTDEEIEEVERWVEFKEEGSGRIPMGKLVAYISNKLRSKNT